MKVRFHFFREKISPHQNRGVALVSVLFITMLTTILMVTFFTMAVQEQRSAKLYNDSTTVHMLKETAVNMVVAQIRDATDDADQLWVSQPGGIRQFGMGGGFTMGFKLYSNEMMVETDELRFALGDGTELEGWSKNGNHWVDLNEAMIRGEKAYFPIVDPAAKTVQKVEGFDFNLASVDPGEMARALAKVDSEPLPMPVQWLYVLNDGTLGFLDERDSFVGTDGSAPSAKEERRIVGRIAFWTDDESTKVNVNTASEPTFWDTPRVNAPTSVTKSVSQPGDQVDDRAYGWSQPTVGEYQRYPGHPAQTALSPILFPGVEVVTLEHKELIANLSPRIAWGGSQGGELAVREAIAVKLDRNYLFPTVDEFIFSADREENVFEVKGTQSGGEPQMEPADLLERSRFFLTTASRAPEVNAFNMPRVSMWPTYFQEKKDGEKARTPYDEMIRFCATTGQAGNNQAAYYFQRRDSDSGTRDWEWIQRNREVYGYLQELMGRRFPGYGGRFKAKYGDDTDQILTEIFDYIRCTNIYDDQLKPTFYNKKQWLNGKRTQFTDGRKESKQFKSFPGGGQVAPIEIEGTKGFGRFYTVSEAGIMFICCADAGGPDPEAPDLPEFEDGVLGSNIPGQEVGQNKALPRKMSWRDKERERCLQASLLFEMFTPSQGWPELTEDMTLEVEVLEEFTVDGETVDFSIGEDVWQSLTGIHKSSDGSIGEALQTTMRGGTVGFWGLTRGRKAPARGTVPADAGVNGTKRARTDRRRQVYPYISAPFIVKGDDELMDFGGGKIAIRIYEGTNHSQKPKLKKYRSLVQELEIAFPSATYPLPRLAVHKGPNAGSGEGSVGGRAIHPSYWWIMNNDGIGVGDPKLGHANFVGRRRRGKPLPTQNVGRLTRFRSPNTTFVQYDGGVKGMDVVRTMVPWHGDYRLIAGKAFVPAKDFVPHRHYFDLGKPLAHHFTGSTTNTLREKTDGGLRYNLGFDSEAQTLIHQLRKGKGRIHSEKEPDFPMTDKNKFLKNHGDFDNGFSITQDGAYINKPDEGVRWQVRVAGSGKLTVPYFTMPIGQITKQISGQLSYEKGKGLDYFSPNRQVPSPVMFGSLPTGVKRGLPWQTLLFRPEEKGHPNNKVPLTGEHQGTRFPPDHALLDLFWMPVVEPYAISEPFSTAGKINLNYQMLPFSYIERSTGVRAVIKSEELLGIPLESAWYYKSGETNRWGVKKGGIPDDRWDLRHPIDMKETLRQFDERFEKGKVFKMANEICDVHLVPLKGERSPARWGETGAVKLEDMRGDYWDKHALTGDNSRERPYANIYPRLTTKSNTYRVHYRCQLIQQGRSSNFPKFNPQTDVVTAEHRGSTLLERYLEPHDPNIPDYVKKVKSKGDKHQTLNEFYKFRIINSRRFSP